MPRFMRRGLARTVRAAQYPLDRQRNQRLRISVVAIRCCSLLQNVLIAVQRFTMTHGNSVRHECDKSPRPSAPDCPNLKPR
jgi:hypothetical protein